MCLRIEGTWLTGLGVVAASCATWTTWVPIGWTEQSTAKQIPVETVRSQRFPPLAPAPRVPPVALDPVSAGCISADSGPLAGAGGQTFLRRKYQNSAALAMTSTATIGPAMIPGFTPPDPDEAPLMQVTDGHCVHDLSRQ